MDIKIFENKKYYESLMLVMIIKAFKDKKNVTNEYIEKKLKINMKTYYNSLRRLK